MSSHSTVFVIDDDLESRQSVHMLVSSMQVQCKAFASGEEFLEEYNREVPACVVADLRMNGMSGIDLQAELVRRGWALPFILISGHVNVQNAVRVMRVGAEHVLEKPYREQELWDAIQRALTISEVRHVRQLRHDELHSRFCKLTDDERHVLDLIVDGLPNKVVARRLGIAPRTVEDRRRRVMEKVGVDSFAALMTTFAELKSLDDDSPGE